MSHIIYMPFRDNNEDITKIRMIDNTSDCRRFVSFEKRRLSQNDFWFPLEESSLWTAVYQRSLILNICST